MAITPSRMMIPTLAGALVLTVGGGITVAAVRAGNDDKPAATAHPTPTPTPRPTKPPMSSRALALRVGKAALLTAHDLPGWTHSGKLGVNTDPGETGLSCDTEPEGIGDAVEVDAPTFDKGPSEITAFVAAYDNTRGPRQDIASAVKKSSLSCLQKELVAATKSQLEKGMRITKSAVRLLPVPHVGEAAGGVRFECTVTQNGSNIPTFSDLIAFSIGRVEVIGVFGNAFTPVSDTTEHRYLRLMESRARRALRGVS